MFKILGAAALASIAAATDAGCACCAGADTEACADSYHG